MTGGSWVVALAAAMAATGGHGPRAPRPGACGTCGVAGRAVAVDVAVLRGSPRPKARARAARALRKVDWKCHPEAVLALADALRRDGADGVREQAAESLGRMAPCVPIAHEALLRAAEGDPEEDVREEARDALKSLGDRCLVACRACGPPPPAGPSVIQGPTILPDAWMPFLTGEPARGPTPAPRPLAPEALPPALAPEALPPDSPPPPPRPESPPLEGPIGSGGLSA